MRLREWVFVGTTLLVAVVAICVSGCANLDDIEIPDIPIPTTTTTPPVVTTLPPAPTTTTQPPAPTGDAIDLSHARTHGTMSRLKPQLATVVCRLDGVRTDTRKMYLRWGQAAGFAHEGDSLLLFYDDGAGATGGQFDFLRGPQSVKLLENIHGGRIGGEPAAGQAYYVLWMSADGKRRSAAVKGDTGWQRR